MRIFTGKYAIALTLVGVLLLSVVCSAQGNRILTAKCSVSQTGGGTGYWQIGITNFNDPGGQITTADIEVGWFVYITDSGTPYPLEITEVVGSPSGSSGTFKVSNVGVTGISSVPTTSSAFVSERTATYNLTPWVANIPGTDNQIYSENAAYLIDQALGNLAGGGGGPTDLTFTGASAPYTLNSSTGTDVTFAAGANVTLGRVGNELTISASGGGSGSTDLSLSGTVSPFTLESSTGTDVTIAQGNGVTLSRSGNQLTVAATSTVTGVSDLINGLDITNSTGTITVAPNINELQSVNTYDGNDQLMFYDNSASVHRKMSLGTYFGSGFVDLLNTQTNIAGEKGFTTGLHYGAAALPTGSAFGTSVATTVHFKYGTTLYSDVNYATTSGLLFHNYVDGSGNQTASVVAVGNDAGSGTYGRLDVLARAAGTGLNTVRAARFVGDSGGAVLVGGNNTGVAGGNLQVQGSGGAAVGFEGGYNNWQTGTINSVSSTWFVAENGSVRAHIDSGADGWVTGSDLRLKDNIETISVLPVIENLRGVKYTLRDGGHPAIGVIAQELEQYFPETCSIPSDPNAMKGVNYNGVAAISLQGVKELYEENKILKARLAEIEQRLAALENK